MAGRSLRAGMRSFLVEAFENIVHDYVRDVKVDGEVYSPPRGSFGKIHIVLLGGV